MDADGIGMIIAAVVVMALAFGACSRDKMKERVQGITITIDCPKSQRVTCARMLDAAIAEPSRNDRGTIEKQD